MEDMMIVTGHGLVGVSIACWTHKRQIRPINAVLIGLASHFVFDAIPHIEPVALGIDYKVVGSLAFVYAFVDNVLGGLICLYYLVRLNLPFWFTGAVTGAAWVPDFLLYLYYKGIGAGVIWYYFNAAHMYVHQLWLPSFSRLPYSALISGVLTLVICMFSLLYLRREGKDAEARSTKQELASVA